MNLGPGIIMDIIVVIIIVLSTIWGAQDGFMFTLTSFIEWFVSIIAGFFCCSWMKSFLIDYTTLDDTINKYLVSRIDETVVGDSAYLSIPDLFGKSVGQQTDSFLYGASASVTSILLTIIAFLIVVFGIRILAAIIERVFSKKYQDGTVGYVDGFIGGAFGLIRGCLVVFLLLAMMVPILGLLLPEATETVMTAMKTSIAADYLYHDNFLLILVRDFIH